MKKLLFIFLFFAPALFAQPYPQNYETTCPVGSVPLNSVADPSNGKQRAFMCIDAFGNVTWNGLGAGGLTQVSSLPPTCTPGTTAPVQLTASPYGVWYCSATNSWTTSGAANPSSTYTFSVSGSTVTATPNAPGLAAYSGSDAAAVINSALSAASATGGTFFFRNGIYPLNSLTLETNDGCTNYYAIGIPNLPSNSWVQYRFAGESKPVLNIGYAFSGVQSNGVIFDVTSTAVSSVSGSAMIMGIWQRPNTATGSTCDNSSTPNFAELSNDVMLYNIGVRFPSNQRGNEYAIAPSFASSVTMENVWAGFNQNEGSLQTSGAPVVGTIGSFGIGSSYSETAEQQHFQNVFAFGFNICFDMNSEHVTGDTFVTEYCNYPMEIGRAGGATVFHPITITHFTDAENPNGIVLGPNMGNGSIVNLLALDVELISGAHWYSRGIGGMSETNLGYSSGLITYSVVLSGTGIEVPAPLLWTKGGYKFTAFEGTGTNYPNFQTVPPNDTFTRANSTGPGSGNWAFVAGSTCNVASNALTTTGFCIMVNYGVPANRDQFAKATIASMTATSNAFVSVYNQSLNGSYYGYGCSTSGGLINREIIKSVSATPTTLVQTSAASGCTAGGGDILELWAFALNPTTTLLRAYYTPSGGARVLDLETTDTTFTSGQPGVVDSLSSGTAGTVTNWSGGSFPVRTISDSWYAQDAVQALNTTKKTLQASYTNASAGSFTTVIPSSGNPGTGLTFPIAQNQTYRVVCNVIWQASAATAGPEFQWTGPGSPTSVAATMESAITATTTASAAATAFSTAMNPVGSSVTATTNERATVELTVINGANAGTVALQAAPQGSGTLTIQPGSSCELK